MTMCRVALLPAVLLLVGFMAAATASKRCEYVKKSVEWSPCDPALHVKTKLVPLLKGKKECENPKIITKPCKVGVEINGCVYVPVSDWSECDPVTGTSTRTLELPSPLSHQCSNNEVESRDCGKASEKPGDGGKKKRKNHRKRKDKRMNKKGGKHCKYKKRKWSDCDSAEGKKVRTLELKRGPPSCKKKKEHIRQCSPHQTRKGKGKGKKGKGKGKKGKGKKRKGKKGKGKGRKKKHKGRKKDKKEKTIVDDFHMAPPKLTEMRVWPLSTSVEVSWTSPDHGTVRGYQVGYGISIPDVYNIDVNASVLHYIIQNLEPEQEYIVSVRARNKAGLGSPLYETVRTGRDKDSGKSGQLLLAPVAVKAVTVSATAIDVSWTDSSVLMLRGGVEEGKLYSVRYMQLNQLSEEDKPTFVLLNTTESSLLVNSLMPYTRFEFAVRVSQGSARSVWSMAATNTTFASAPSSKPAEFTADIEQSDPTTVKLTWQPPEQPNGPITGYVIFYSKDPIQPDNAWATSVVTGNRLSTLVKDLDPNEAYFFKIQARNQEGVGPSTSPVTVTVPDVLPSVPRNLTSVGLEHNPSAVMLRWQRPEKVLEPITGYVIYYTENPDLPEGSWVVHDVGGDRLNNTLNDLRPSAKYFFKLQARNKAGTGPSTSPISHVLPDGLPTVPRNLSVTQFAELPGAAIVSWLPPEDMGKPITGYVVSYREDHSDQWSEEGVLGDSLSLLLPSLLPGTTYTFKVQAQAEDHLGPTSAVVVYTTPQDTSGQLLAPTDVMVYVLSSSSAVMSWRDPMLVMAHVNPAINHNDNNDDTSSSTTTYTVRYRVLLSSSGGSSPHPNPPSFSNYTYLSPPSFPSLYLVDLAPSTTYEFSVRLNRGADQHSAWSTAVFNKTLEAAPRSPPANVSVMEAEEDPSVARITWSLPLKPNGVITGYVVFSSLHRKQPIRDWQVWTVQPEPTYLTVRELTPGTKYFFKLQARNAQGFGPLSPPVLYKTRAVHGGRAEDLTVVASPDDPYSAIVSWQPPSKKRSQISYYMLVCLDVDAEEVERREVPGDELTAVVHDLLPARTYRFTVQPRYRHSSGPHSTPVDYVLPKERLVGYGE